MFMWNAVCILLLVVQISLLTVFAVGRGRKKKRNTSGAFLVAVFAVSLSLQLIPYLYGLLVLHEPGNYILDGIVCIKQAIALFVGDIEVEKAAALARDLPVFSYVYALGVVLVLLATISTALDVFSNSLRNRFRLNRLRKAPVCDIVIGCGKTALQYAKNSQAVLLLEDSVEKTTADSLKEAGYTVLRGNFTPQLLHSRILNTGSRYNLICPEQAERFLSVIDVFLTYKKQHPREKQIHLYVELPQKKIPTVTRQIVEKSGFSDCIHCFSSQELLARAFMQRHPVTEHLPKDFISQDTSVAPGKRIQTVFLGFGEQSQALYRQSILNNQLVHFAQGQYKVLALEYHIFDEALEEDVWQIRGLEKALAELETNKEAYFPLPELPYRVQTQKKAPWTASVQAQVKTLVEQPDTFTVLYIDTGDDYRDIELGGQLQASLFQTEAYHIFVRSDAAYAENSRYVSSYGDLSGIFDHDVIVNDALAEMARTMNALYENIPTAQAQDHWSKLDGFSCRSNISAAENLRLKLHLLGLDYIEDGKGENTQWISERYPAVQHTDYSAYLLQGKRNALLAQEHARWNAFHLLEGFAPMRKQQIQVKAVGADAVRFQTKDMCAKQHACLTTFRGLDELSSYLAQTAAQLTQRACTPAAYDYYAYDDMLLRCAAQLCRQLGYTITEKE